ncbi:MAG: zinc ribbon domain-containing protein [Thermodesulfobacteriota bacterium]|nr:zinc ribbon domain-containing protein [Thermodesulfobacteriota bacterium]
MPIYEFYCQDCNTIFSFFSKSVNTTKRPLCPSCKKRKLKRQMSPFSRLKGAKEESDLDDLPIDEAKMEKAMGLLAQEAEGINEDDPRQAANLMRKFTEATGASLGPGMEEALKRMEAGEDPDQIEAELGDLIEEEEPFVFGEKRTGRVKKTTPRRDERLYDL